MKSLKAFLVLFTVVQSCVCFGQENTITVGIQVKPIVPSNFAKAGAQTFDEQGVKITMNQQTGYAGGMVLRKGITDKFSFETGINYVKRNYQTILEDNRVDLIDQVTFSTVGYEIPLLGLLYIQLTDMFYMNTAFGLSIDTYASNVKASNDFFTQSSIRRRWLQPALLANVGFEMRTKKSGIFYLGASLHRPFMYSYATKVDYINAPYTAELIEKIYGSYFTIDLRYFFHEDPEKRKKKSN